MKFHMNFRWPAALAWVFLGFSGSFFGAAPRSAAAPPADDLQNYHSSIPAGYDVITLKPSGAMVSFLGLIECPELEGVRQTIRDGQMRVVAPDGRSLKNYPRNFSFRITASLRKTFIFEPNVAVASTEEPRDLLLKLKFRLRAYDGLAAREIAPRSINMIGMPPETPYDERIYRISFQATEIHVSSRIVLDVMAPTGERLTRFHFDLL